MKRYLPLLLASTMLIAGGGGILTHHLLTARENLFDVISAEYNAEAIIKSEAVREIALEEKIQIVNRRIGSRLEIARMLFYRKISIANAFEIYDELNHECPDPSRFEDGYKTEHERLSWIAQQLEVNIENIFMNDLTQQQKQHKAELLQEIDWMLIEMEM
jgi:hypothetical protein